MRSCEGTGRTIEQAIQNALFDLKASRDDVDIKILSEGGFLKKAKVLVTISEDALPKYEKIEALKKKEKKEEVKEEKEDNFVKTFLTKKIEITENDNNVKIVADEEYIVPAKEEGEEKEEKRVDAEKLLNEILGALNLTAEITKEEDEKFIRYKLTGENLNDLIGHHGECMFALSSYLSTVCKNENHKKLFWILKTTAQSALKP